MAEIVVPTLGESIVDATVGRWLKAIGDPVKLGDGLVELETDKVNMEVSSTAAGTLESILKQEGETVEVGEPLAVINESAEAVTSAEAQEAAQAQVVASEAQGAPAAQETPVAVESVPVPEAGGRATPVARRMAEEHGINLAQVAGTGPSGRVTKEDITSFLAKSPKLSPTEVSLPVANGQVTTDGIPSPTDATTGRWEERVKMSRRRQTIARRLVEAQHNAAMLTTFNEVNMGRIMELRRERKEAFKERHGINLGYMSFFTRAVTGSLKAFPRLNAEIQGDEMILKHYYDIGIAVGVEEGLVVPVVRDADRLSFAEIESQIADLAARARANKLGLADLQGGTFTITNGGTFGSLLSTPILNAPQVGILGMHKIEERPVALDGEIAIQPMMYLALSYDHRIVDGAEAVRFLVRVKELLEDPERLLLEA
ncbi:MAG: 2-oxoglutarate dehydrogenase complex dihydrolipoyllysine-residue succinyltransferase [Chloroflexota bacterium]